MKICPNCQKTYADDNLNFCLEDGSVLSPAGGPPPTVMMTQPAVTSGSTSPGAPTIQSSFGNQPQYAVPQKRSSKTWLWVTGIFVILLVLCGGGGILGVLWVAYQQQEADTTESAKTNSAPIAVNKRTSTNSTSPSPAPQENTPSGEAEIIDLSMWVKEFSPYGKTEMVGDEFVMSSKQKDYYYALVSSPDYSTDGATTSVVLRNIDTSPTDLGYGLIFNSDKAPLVNGYAFLIDTVKKRYRIVRHKTNSELPIVPWTSSPVINGGSGENILEVRDKGDTLEFYINRQMVKSIKDQYGVRDGVPGLYAGDGVRVAFKNLEIRK